ncbi:hypothetical protein H6P81_010194 [Aristolochia fimbriata]|uniref:Glycosyl transferase family 3 domain-containing protein n=1 Tax=Aristolochia fimbriata TaxID=158543 RepID=A0AAV7ENP4_ARIFI|nr:hypothetical protein H6P81_010194 [Aristolochia fimbriata]
MDGKIVGLARAMIKYCRKVEGVADGVDIVGTRGVGANTVNISTGASILIAPSREKQGSCASSSAWGSANILEVLGVSIDLDPH